MCGDSDWNYVRQTSTNSSPGLVKQLLHIVYGYPVYIQVYYYRKRRNKALFNKKGKCNSCQNRFEEMGLSHEVF